MLDGRTVVGLVCWVVEQIGLGVCCYVEWWKVTGGGWVLHGDTSFTPPVYYVQCQKA